MTKLLDYVKQKGLSHEEAMKRIEDSFGKPEDEPAEPTAPEIKDGETDKPDDDIDKLVQELADKEEAEIKKLADEEEAKLKADKDKIAELVQEELKKRGKVKRKTPSKGELTTIPKLKYELNTSGYEVKTTRRTKKD